MHCRGGVALQSRCTLLDSTQLYIVPRRGLLMCCIQHMHIDVSARARSSNWICGAEQRPCGLYDGNGTVPYTIGIVLVRVSPATVRHSCSRNRGLHVRIAERCYLSRGLYKRLVRCTAQIYQALLQHSSAAQGRLSWRPRRSRHIVPGQEGSTRPRHPETPTLTPGPTPASWARERYPISPSARSCHQLPPSSPTICRAGPIAVGKGTSLLD